MPLHTIGLSPPPIPSGNPRGASRRPTRSTSEGMTTVKLLSAAVLSAVFVVAGCGSPDSESAPLEIVSTSAAPASTLPRVEPAADSGGADGGQQLGILHSGWLLVSGSVDEQPIPTEPDLVLRFGETRLSFPLSCNSASIPYEVDGTSIELDLDNFETTLEACPTDQADMFLASLPLVDTIAMGDNGQQLEFEGDGVSIQFTRTSN